MPLDRKDGLRPAQVRRRVQETAHKLLGPIRNGEELTRFLHFLDRTNREEVPSLATASKNPIYNKEWLDALELANLVHLLTCAAQSALFRTESRGVHYREEFPFSDNDNWMKESRVIREEDALRVSSRPVTVTTLTPPSGKIPFLDMMKKMMQSRSDIGGHH